MLLQKRVDRAFRYQQERLQERQGGENRPQTEEYDPRQEREKTPLIDVMEKGDMPAMILSALLIIVPVCLVLLLLVVGISWLAMGV